MESCPGCGGEIVRGVTMSQTVEAGNTGLQYRAALVLSGTEPLLADLCTRCGTVLRLWVKTPGRKWITKA